MFPAYLRTIYSLKSLSLISPPPLDTMTFEQGLPRGPRLPLCGYDPTACLSLSERGSFALFFPTEYLLDTLPSGRFTSRDHSSKEHFLGPAHSRISESSPQVPTRPALPCCLSQEADSSAGDRQAMRQGTGASSVSTSLLLFKCRLEFFFLHVSLPLFLFLPFNSFFLPSAVSPGTVHPAEALLIGQTFYVHLPCSQIGKRHIVGLQMMKTGTQHNSPKEFYLSNVPCRHFMLLLNFFNCLPKHALWSINCVSET